MATAQQVSGDLKRLTERIVGTIAIGTQESWTQQSRRRTGRAAASVQYGFGRRSPIDNGLTDPSEDQGRPTEENYDEHFDNANFANIGFLVAAQLLGKQKALNYKLGSGPIIVSSRIYYGETAYKAGGRTGTRIGAISAFADIAGSFFGGRTAEDTVRRAVLVGISRASRLRC